eukprot:TRINITY_DN1909_c0_g2_i1.p1 TRINITY_DN1909_c0_g2~~TRINITY_DN1909_c0_g2_i1.p1  ORF type:complete len:406 (-),score=56.43 TRINITY_DN1909_c0_g2_i1:249-1466(-)
MDRLKSLVLRSPLRCMASQVSDEAATSGSVPAYADACLSKPSDIRYNCARVEEAPTADSLPEFPGNERQGSDSSSTSAGEETQLPLPAPADVQAEVDACVLKAGNAAVWQPKSFELIKTLQSAARNQGRVELMKKLDTGAFVAVKRMPVSWTARGHKEFVRDHQRETEMPWVDIGLVNFLHSKGVDWICEPLGVYRDDHETFVVSALANQGDLFDWTQTGPIPGPERESFIVPVASQVFSALQYLHRLSIAHCDFSLENILLTQEEGGPLQVKIIDFGMSVVKQNHLCGPRGKPSYQAPEMHIPGMKYDPFLGDSFGLGVVVFGMAAQDYPWLSTRPQACKCFEYMRANGLRAFLQKRKSRRNGEGKRLGDIFSEALVEVLESLLAVNPSDRARVDARKWRWLEQ